MARASTEAVIGQALLDYIHSLPGYPADPPTLNFISRLIDGIRQHYPSDDVMRQCSARQVIDEIEWFFSKPDGVDFASLTPDEVPF